MEMGMMRSSARTTRLYLLHHTLQLGP